MNENTLLLLLFYIVFFSVGLFSFISIVLFNINLPKRFDVFIEKYPLIFLLSFIFIYSIACSFLLNSLITNI